MRVYFYPIRKYTNRWPRIVVTSKGIVPTGEWRLVGIRKVGSTSYVIIKLIIIFTMHENVNGDCGK